MKSSDAFIYGLYDSRSDAIRYVGWTVNPLRRLRWHIKESENGKSHKCWWMRQVLGKQGYIRLEILKMVPREKARSAEIEEARRLKSLGAQLTNHGPGGDLEPWGWNRGLTKETDPRVARAADALRMAMLGNHHGLGKVHSVETRRKLSEAQKRSWTIERRQQQSLRLKKNHPSRGRHSWSAGLTKRDHPSIARGAERSAISHRGQIPWNKGLKRG